VLGLVITGFDNQASARVFKNKLERRGIRVYRHRYPRGYPTDVHLIVRDEGYGANEYIETGKHLVIVTGRGRRAEGLFNEKGLKVVAGLVLPERGQAGGRTSEERSSSRGANRRDKRFGQGVG